MCTTYSLHLQYFVVQLITFYLSVNWLNTVGGKCDCMLKHWISLGLTSSWCFSAVSFKTGLCNLQLFRPISILFIPRMLTKEASFSCFSTYFYVIVVKKFQNSKKLILQRIYLRSCRGSFTYFDCIFGKRLHKSIFFFILCFVDTIFHIYKSFHHIKCIYFPHVKHFFCIWQPENKEKQN